MKKTKRIPPQTYNNSILKTKDKKKSGKQPERNDTLLIGEH